MALPIINSPFLPSVADVPAFPPKLKDMPIMNPGTHTYLCEDGITRVMTEEQAINLGINCRVADEDVIGPAAPLVVTTGPLVMAGARFRAVNLGDRRVVRRI